MPSVTAKMPPMNSSTVSSAFTNESASTAANEVYSSLSAIANSTLLQMNTSSAGTYQASTTTSPTSSSGSNETITTYTEMNGTHSLDHTQTVDNSTISTPAVNTTITPFVSTATVNASFADTTIADLINKLLRFLQMELQLGL